MGKLTEAQRSMLDDRFKWKVRFLFWLSILLLLIFPLSYLLYIYIYLISQAREMEKRKEGRPGEARAALRRSVRDNGYVLKFCFLILFCLSLKPLRRFPYSAVSNDSI